MKESKVFIGIPTMGNVPWQFCSSLRALELSAETKICWSVRTMIHTARNLLVQNFLKEENKQFTHILQIDDDMIFDPDFLLKLLSHDVDVVGGLATKRRPPFEPCVYREENGKYRSIIPNIFQEVDAVGTGGILIKREVFAKLKFPYFETGYDEEGNNWSVDFNFSKLCKKNGIKVFVDPDAKMGHLGEQVVGTIEKHLSYHEKESIDNRSL